MTNPNTQDHTDAFYVNWANGFRELGIDPTFPMKAAMHESEARAQAWNHASNTVGLIQFTPETLKYLGFPGTYRDMQGLTAAQQIPWVLKFYKPYAAYIKSPALAYVLTYLPSLVKEASESPLGNDFVLAQDGGKLSWAYNANPGFDHGKKGFITVGDLQQTIDGATHGSRWDEIQARLQSAIDGKTPLVPPQKIAGNPPDPIVHTVPNPGPFMENAYPSITTSGANIALIGGTALLLGYLGYRYIKANPVSQT
jgi:hypothetical protein